MERRLHMSYDVIVQVVDSGSRVLDLGCGDGELLNRLIREKQVHGRGVELEEEMILRCISKGISVFQGNLDEGLKDYATKSYDFVVLNQTLQVIRNPVLVLEEMLRVGKKAIVSFPNFGYYVTRLQLMFNGRMPLNHQLPYEWYRTPNIHLCTHRDFVMLCKNLEIGILSEIALINERRLKGLPKNLFATEVCYVLERAANGNEGPES
ncbi:MAG TPA: methionine biosynthesis protein MetW [Spirochaetia bacterium]|nr:methionine biosynthesis protein MetW [Spirochaetia bacterium]